MLTQNYQSIINKKSDIINNYKTGKSIKEIIAASFKDFQAYSSDFCSANQTKKDQITNIRK